MFTSIPAAIEEARLLRALTGRCHGVVQRPGGNMVVKVIDRRGMHTLFTTKQDRHGTVKTEGIS